jgi:O-antigen/teichoic acid export membrane protein
LSSSISKTKSFAATATTGMIWMSVSVLLARLMLFVMQFFLGYMLDARDYSVFAAVSVALTSVCGLQNAGASKMLIQQQDRYHSLVRDYTNFSLYMGLLGGGVLIVLGLGFGQYYRNPALIYVIALSAISVPFTSLNSIQSARLIIDLRFRTMCIIDFFVAAANTTIVLGAAYFGARYYSIGLGLVASTTLRYVLYRFNEPTLNPSFSLAFDRFMEILGHVKWLVIVSFLTGLSQQGDYLVLGRAISPEALGYYYFGFQLTANVGQLLAQGIFNTLFPMFASMKDDTKALGRVFLRSSSIIHFTCCVLSLGLVGFAPWLMHFIWRGKWDMAIATAVAMALSLPTRLLSPLGNVTLDSVGKWRLRTALIVVDAGTMMLAALIGAYIDGLFGASVGVAVQRFLSGLTDFSIGVYVTGGTAMGIVRFAARTFVPFWVPAAGLVLVGYAQPMLSSDWQTALVSVSRTAAAIVVFALLAYSMDRSVISEVYTLIRGILFKKRAAPV